MYGYALLDFDGYICKAFYAAVARNKEAPFEEMDEILESLTQAAITKANKLFSSVKIIKAVSGHTFKKDIYPSYKRSRKRDERLGEYREHVIGTDKTILKINCLEADDVCISIDNYINGMASSEPRSIIFSDDKDLRKYCLGFYCKINLTEEVDYPCEYNTAPFIQMLTGDKEDNVKGIPLVGEKKAKKFLDETSYDLESVVLRYIEAKVDIDECLKNILLVTPIIINDETYLSYIINNIPSAAAMEDKILFTTIMEYLSDLSEIVKEIYNKYD